MKVDFSLEVCGSGSISWFDSVFGSRSEINLCAGEVSLEVMSTLGYGSFINRTS
jgi:hypothetical protein